MNGDDDNLPYDFLTDAVTPELMREIGNRATYRLWVAIDLLIGPNPYLRRRIMMIENDPRGDAVLVYRTVLIFFARLNRLVFAVSTVEQPSRDGDDEAEPDPPAE